MAEINNSTSTQMKQDLAIRIREHEDEITRLRNRLADYSTKDAQEERSMFVSSMMNLLGEYSLQPSSQDALSIVSKVKVLFKHLQQQLIRIENKDGLELVPQPGTDRDGSGYGGNDGVAVNDLAADEWERRPARTNLTRGGPAKSVIKQGEEKTRKEVKFREPGRTGEVVDDPRADGNHQNGEQTSAQESSDADDDPLPAIEDLQILGEAVPGREVQACGYSINGTTICNFEWVRHLEDGSLNYIEGAVQPTYLVTADDVDTYLAIEVLPLDDRNRKGEPVKVFANEKKKIACDPAVLSYIEKTLYSGHASYEVSLSTGYLDIWEPATLAIKREGYSIKCSGPRGVVVAEKFSPAINVMIPYGRVSEFVIICSSGVELLLRAENKSTDIHTLADPIRNAEKRYLQLGSESQLGKPLAVKIPSGQWVWPCECDEIGIFPLSRYNCAHLEMVHPKGWGEKKRKEGFIL
ncbi:uncharacterized protein G2W53_034346 [Senna tora]|uniref:Uncharacterized protein n=1 Tax=Senna tora TaxID=362788 RepID=A0A834T0D0_9FABA|nr:uncharacterized protein G2W53_034346 [Senna tora]